MLSSSPVDARTVNNDDTQSAGQFHRSLLFSLIDRYGNIVILVLSTAILSRLLTPAEFGQFAVIGALTTVSSAALQEFGGANYLIQKATLSRQDIRTAFTVSFCTVAALAAGFVGLSGVLASFYGLDDLATGLILGGLGLMTGPFYTTISALLRRRLEFGVLSFASICGSFITAAVSILLAIQGLGFMAPVYGSLVGMLAGLLLLLTHWKDLGIFRPSLAGYREVFAFGAYSAATVLVNVVYNFLPQIVLGRALDFAAVGLYSRALGVAQIFDKAVIQAIHPVIMPAVAGWTRNGGDLRKIYLNSLGLITAIQWPFLTFVALAAEPLVRVWLGPQWTDAVALVQLLCLAFMSVFMAPLSYPVLVATGRIKDTLTASLISLIPSMLITGLAALHSLSAVAASTLLTFPLQAIVSVHFVGRQLHVSFGDIFRATASSALVTLCCAVAIFAGLAGSHLIAGGPLLELALAGSLAVLAWGYGLRFTNHHLLRQFSDMATTIAASSAMAAFFRRK